MYHDVRIIKTSDSYWFQIMSFDSETHKVLNNTLIPKETLGEIVEMMEILKIRETSAE